MSCFSSVHFPTNHRAQLETLASDWMTKYMKEKLFLQNTLVKHYVKLLLIIVLKEHHYLHIVTFLYQVNSNSLTRHPAKV